jgi:biofilm protein TabA
MLFTAVVFFSGCKSSDDPSSWSSGKIDKWFEKRDWLNGWNVKPDSSINRRELAVSYFKNRERWEKAFTFLKNTDLSKLEARRYDIDGDNLYALVSSYMTKNEEDAKFEVHRKYIDIQYVISGTEQMSITPLSMIKEVLEPYDPAKDIEFVTVKSADNRVATPEVFFIFFPSDVHRPGVKIGENKEVHKIVMKVKAD